MVKRFTTSSHHDPTITQRVRTALYDAGHGELVDEALFEGMRDIEQMARDGLSDHEKRLLILEEAERDRLTKTGVWTFVKAKLDEKAVSGVSRILWGTGAVIGTLLITGLLTLAWKGLHT